MREWGIETSITIRMDASAAIGIITRRGSGKLRHIQTNELWLQDKISSGAMAVKKIPGVENDADLGTKPLQESAISAILWRMCCRIVGGQASESWGGDDEDIKMMTTDADEYDCNGYGGDEEYEYNGNGGGRK